MVECIAPIIAPAAPSGGNDPQLMAMVQRLMDKQDLARAPAPAFNVADIAAIITAAAPILTLIQGMIPKPQPMGEMLTLLTTAKALVGSEQPESEDGLFGLAKMVLGNPQFGDALAALARPQSGNPPGNSRMLPAPQIAQLPPPERAALLPHEMTAEQIQAQNIATLQNELARLCQMAAKNSSPSLWAEVLEETVPPEFLTMLQSSTALEFLIQIYPPVQTNRLWFQALIAELNAPRENDADPGFDDINQARHTESETHQRAPIVSQRSASPLNVAPPFGGSEGGYANAENNGDIGEAREA